MTHKFLLSIDTSQNSRFDQLVSYLKENGLIKSVQNGAQSSSSSEGTIYVYVGDKKKFLTYLNKRNSNRDSDDPRDMIKGVRYQGKEKPKPPKESKMLHKALQRIRNQPRNENWRHSS